MRNLILSKKPLVYAVVLWTISLATVLLLWFQGTGHIAWLNQHITVSSQSTQPIRHGQYGFRVVMGTKRLSQNGSFKSPAILLEDGHPLGPGNTSVAEIGEHGGGRFSFWKGRLYFFTLRL